MVPITGIVISWLSKCSAASVQIRSTHFFMFRERYPKVTVSFRSTISTSRLLMVALRGI